MILKFHKTILLFVRSSSIKLKLDQDLQILFLQMFLFLSPPDPADHCYGQVTLILPAPIPDEEKKLT